MMNDKHFQAKLAELDCKTDETEESKIKYLNINVSDSEVKRNPDVVRLYSDVGVLEYVKPKADVVNKIRTEIDALLKVYPFIDHYNMYVKLDDVKKIIDKYIESEK